MFYLENYRMLQQIMLECDLILSLPDHYRLNLYNGNAFHEDTSFLK